jgi:hypothetical protein
VRRAALVLAVALLAACGAIEDAVDQTASKPDDKPDPAPLTLPPAGPPTSEFQSTPSDQVRAFCEAVDDVAAAVAAGGIAAAQPALEHLAATSQVLGSVPLGPQDAATVAECAQGLQAALNPG